MRNTAKDYTNFEFDECAPHDSVSGAKPEICS